MKKQNVVFPIFFLLISSIPTFAWNNKGHMTVAYIAYRNLKPEVRLKVYKLLERHPDFAYRLRDYAGSPGSPNFRIIVFMNAATWPDSIREDSRFYDEKDPDSLPTIEIPGFPTMRKYKRWHYIDLPFSPDGSQTTGPDGVNALKAMRSFRGALNNANVRLSYQAYFLAWLLHIIGDVHQPLHSTSRFTKDMTLPDYPDGDRGGNEFKIVPFPLPEANYSADNLHSFWDGILGVRRDIGSINALGQSIMNEYPKPNAINLDEQVWITESFDYARNVVYKLTPNQSVPPLYVTGATKLARQRMAIAGYRLAEVLNQRFN